VIGVDVKLKLGVVVFATGVLLAEEKIVLEEVGGVVVVSFFLGMFVSIPTLKTTSDVSLGNMDTISSSSVRPLAS